MKRRFEEILEECLSAQLEGRRSVEDSLSLYPSLATELGPLLRTAEDISSAFEGLDPPSHLIDRGRLRFVTVSLEDRRARQITRGVRGFDRSRVAWNFRQWGMLGSGVAAVVGLLLVGAALLIAGGGGDSGDDFAGNPSGTGSSESALFAANLEELQSQLSLVKLRARRGVIGPSDLEDLRYATSELGGSGQPPDDESRQAVEDALNDQYAFVIDIADDLPPEQGQQLQDVLATTQKAANDLGIAIVTTATPAASDEPVPTPTPVATTPAATSPSPTDSATQSSAPTQSPQPTPTPPVSTGN